jgi:RNA polymerase sigma-70 factor (ECF subfamily)
VRRYAVLPDDDRENVALCKRGDTDAFEVLVRKHQKQMLNIAYRIVGNYEEACEVVQDAFLSAYRNMRNFEERSRFSTWLCTIVMNLSRNRLRKLHGTEAAVTVTRERHECGEGSLAVREPVSREPSALERIERKEMQETVQRCISAIPPELREVLVLRDIQGFSYGEIGGMLRLAEGTVKSRLFRARDSLRDCLKRVLGDLHGIQ